MSLGDVVYAHAGDERTVKEWCRILKISYNTVKSRHARGADTFEKLFKIRPSQIRRIDRFTAEHAEDILRHVDLLELLFDQVIRERILAFAKSEYTSNPVKDKTYSVRDTLHELVRRGLLYTEKRMAEYEREVEADNAWRKNAFPDGMPSVTKGAGTIGWRVDEEQRSRIETPTNNIWKPLTPEEDLAEIKAIFGE